MELNSTIRDWQDSVDGFWDRIMGWFEVDKPGVDAESSIYDFDTPKEYDDSSDRLGNFPEKSITRQIEDGDIVNSFTTRVIDIPGVDDDADTASISMPIVSIPKVADIEIEPLKETGSQKFKGRGLLMNLPVELDKPKSPPISHPRGRMGTNADKLEHRNQNMYNIQTPIVINQGGSSVNNNKTDNLISTSTPKSVDRNNDLEIYSFSGA